MPVVFVSFGPGGRFNTWSLLFLLVPLLLDGSLFKALAVLIQMMFGIAPELRAAPTRQQAPVPQHVRTSAAQQAAEDYEYYELGWAFEVVRGIVFTVAGFMFFRAATWLRRRNSWAELLGASQPRQQQQQQQQQAVGRPRVTLEQVAEALQKVPTELHATDSQLEAMSIHDLKVRLEARGVDCSQFLEKRELLEQLHSCGGSSTTTCSICCDDFEVEDPVRVLPCQHRYHLECIDKWLLSCTDFTRPPACPLCNAELIKHPSTATTANATPAADTRR